MWLDAVSECVGTAESSAERVARKKQASADGRERGWLTWRSPVQQRENETARDRERERESFFACGSITWTNLPVEYTCCSTCYFFSFSRYLLPYLQLFSIPPKLVSQSNSFTDSPLSVSLPVTLALAKALYFTREQHWHFHCKQMSSRYIFSTQLLDLIASVWFRAELIAVCRL